MQLQQQAQTQSQEIPFQTQTQGQTLHTNGHAQNQDPNLKTQTQEESLQTGQHLCEECGELFVEYQHLIMHLFNKHNIISSASPVVKVKKLDISPDNGQEKWNKEKKEETTPTQMTSRITR